MKAVSGGVERTLSQTFVDELLGAVAAATAAGANTQRLFQMGQLARTPVDGFNDLAVGYGFAQTYVHGRYLNANRSRLQLPLNPICG
jgi:hypothetical protein